MARSTGKRLTGVILFILAAVGVAAFAFVLFADAEGLDSVPGTGEIPGFALAAAIAMAIIALILVILLIVRSYDNVDEESETAEAFFIPDEDDDWDEVVDEEPEPEPMNLSDDDVQPVYGATDDGRLTRERVVPMDLAGVPLGSHAWGTTASDDQGTVYSFQYPCEEASALYNNDYITINKAGDRLKLRTLLAAAPGIFDGKKDAKIRGPDKKKFNTAAPAKAKKAAPKAPAAAPVAAKPRKRRQPTTYYDYTGDIHPVIDVEGIGEVYARKLAAIGVKTTARLCYEEAASLARSLEAPEKSVQSWQDMAQLMKVNGIGQQYAEVLVRAGITSIPDLKKRKAANIASQVNDYVASLKSTIIGHKISERRVLSWQEAAKPMRKVRQAIPEE